MEHEAFGDNAVIPPIHDNQTEILFDSRDPFYRSPTGAVPAGTAIGLSLLIPKGECPLSVTVWFAKDGTPAKETELVFTENIRQYQRWTATVTPTEAGVYWYTFRIKTPKGVKIYGRDLRNRPVCGRENPSAWQITSYDPTLKAPKGWAGGMFYQIFPDRFYREGEQVRPAGKEYATFRTPEELPTWKRAPNGDLDTTDFFGGNLKGIEKKLDYLKDLGVTILYLNPIFEAYTNHRYDTGNYEKIDPFLGTEEDFRSLCTQAHARGIKIMLDGVFSHTGDNSIYFNRYGDYPNVGAYQSKESPYYPWFKFKKWPDDYESWWGIKLHPEVDEENPDYLEYITGKNGILRRWLRAGADGWRFDVADELPDGFLDAAHKAIKEEKPDALFIGEVWEDASNKESYGKRRRYLLGDQLDSVMNYVLKDAILAFVLTGDSDEFAERIRGLTENYPPCALNCAMNLIGTHDTPRVLTTLTGVELPKEPAAQVAMTFTEEQKAEAMARLKVADILMFTLPGIPSVYYGDEAGMWGGHDPLNRQFYPWGKENKDLQKHIRTLGHLRKNYPVLKEGTTEILSARQGLVIFRRRDGIHPDLTVAVNASREERNVDLGQPRTDLITGKRLTDKTTLSPMSAIVLKN
ncbi:MAG: glycoside hydrolase family 13 protein [Clostridia bacterium]|nr:glycoside hydrolase family 13 protein [Clostridia bacterium]